MLIKKFFFLILCVHIFIQAEPKKIEFIFIDKLCSEGDMIGNLDTTIKNNSVYDFLLSLERATGKNNIPQGNREFLIHFLKTSQKLKSEESLARKFRGFLPNVLTQNIRKVCKVFWEIVCDAPPSHPFKIKSKIVSRWWNWHFVEGAKVLFPGQWHHRLVIERMGYLPESGLARFTPGRPYIIKASLLPKKRYLFYSGTNHSTIPQAIKLIYLDTGKELTSQDKFAVGTTVCVAAKYKKYRTAYKALYIPSGWSSFFYDHHINVGKIIGTNRFYLKRKSIELDGIKYLYEFYRDKEKISSHHVEMEKLDGKFLCEIGRYPESRFLKIYAGYFVMQRKFDEYDWESGDPRLWKGICLRRLLLHLRKVAKKFSVARALDILRGMVGSKSIRGKMEGTGKEEVGILKNFVKGSQEEQERGFYKLIDWLSKGLLRKLAKPRRVFFQVEYDVVPCEKPGLKISVKMKNSSCILKQGDMLLPGKYLFTLRRQGYHSQSQMIQIDPSEKPYYIAKLKMKAKLRRLVFKYMGERPFEMYPFDLGTGKRGQWKKLYRPGRVSLLAKFRNRKTVYQSFRIPLGEGPFEVKVKTGKVLRKLEFCLKKNSENLAGVEYPYEFYSEDEKIEAHHIQIEKRKDGYCYKIYVDPKYENLRIYAGYLCKEEKVKDIASSHKLTNPWRWVCLKRGIQHIKNIRERNKDYFGLDVLKHLSKEEEIDEGMQKAWKEEIKVLIESDELKQKIIQMLVKAGHASPSIIVKPANLWQVEIEQD